MPWRDLVGDHLAERARQPCVVGLSYSYNPPRNDCNPCPAPGRTVTPNTILRWYRELIAKRYDGSDVRHSGRPPSPDSVRQLVIRFATDNPSRGYTRIWGALRNLGHALDASRSSGFATSMDLSKKL